MLNLKFFKKKSYNNIDSHCKYDKVYLNYYMWSNSVYSLIDYYNYSLLSVIFNYFVSLTTLFLFLIIFYLFSYDSK